MLPQRSDHARAALRFALDLHVAAAATEVRPGAGAVQIRVGLALGPVTSGVIGSLRARYCVFGDTGACFIHSTPLLSFARGDWFALKSLIRRRRRFAVNMASRMESSGTTNCVQLSAECFDACCLPGDVAAAKQTNVKGKGWCTTHTVGPAEARASHFLRSFVCATNPSICRRSNFFSHFPQVSAVRAALAVEPTPRAPRASVAARWLRASGAGAPTSPTPSSPSSASTSASASAVTVVGHTRLPYSSCLSTCGSVGDEMGDDGGGPDAASASSAAAAAAPALSPPPHVGRSSASSSAAASGGGGSSVVGGGGAASSPAPPAPSAAAAGAADAAALAAARVSCELTHLATSQLGSQVLGACSLPQKGLLFSILSLRTVPTYR